MKRIRLLIADDRPRSRAGLRALLATWPDLEIVAEADNGQDAVRLAAECRPDLVLMDAQMPIMGGLEATRLLKQEQAALKVIVLTMYPAERAAALSAGADAFLVKGCTTEKLLETIRKLVPPKNGPNTRKEPQNEKRSSNDDHGWHQCHLFSTRWPFSPDRA